MLRRPAAGPAIIIDGIGGPQLNATSGVPVLRICHADDSRGFFRTTECRSHDPGRVHYLGIWDTILVLCVAVFEALPFAWIEMVIASTIVKRAMFGNRRWRAVCLCSEDGKRAVKCQAGIRIVPFGFGGWR